MEMQVHPSIPPAIFQEITINDTLIIPPEKPPAEAILENFVELEITKAIVINTPLTTGQPPQPVRKVVITGKAQIVVKYVAIVPDQQVHAAVFHVPFEALVEWPGGPPPDTPICVFPVVEHFQVEMIDSRRLFKVLIAKLNVYYGLSFG